MRTITIMVGLLGCGLVAGCGGDDGGRTCPPGYPIERDGMCFRADGGGMDAGGGGDDAGGGGDDAGGGGDDAGGGGDDAGPVADTGPVTCMQTHPLVMGERRYCNPGDCYCADPDACFSEATADACCAGPIVCGDGDGGTVTCMGTHPIVAGSMRTCDPGNCFCAAPDACFSTATADTCCPGEIVCY